MRTSTRNIWLCLHVMCIMDVGSSPSSKLAFTQSEVGLDTVLPCRWHRHEKRPSELPYIQWQTISDVVFERMGHENFQAAAYSGRADVPEGVLERGNCSLLLRDVRFSDAGVYESYLVVNGESYKRRIFIQSVQLSVLDHKSEQAVEKGKDLTLDLYTDQAEVVVFQSSEASMWTQLWQRSRSEDSLDPRVEEGNRKLIIRTVRGRDEGTYKVMDGEGLALSTVKVSVKEPVLPTEAVKVEKRVGHRNHIAPDSSVGRNSVHLSTFLLLMLPYLL
ncbi:uncharacterized protein LOC134318550 [Trichomycterus rosablanca]|uniref:uncharacterized protein LOC134318550 n=1 Tax=Trichomycterus rosablanca TaxID=2290929 RepID=UPI002F35C743